MYHSYSVNRPAHHRSARHRRPHNKRVNLSRTKRQVRYDIMPSASLNHRFVPLEGLRTEAVLSLDDDVLAPCADLSKAFAAWRQDKYRMVGFYPRLHAQKGDCRRVLWHGARGLAGMQAAAVGTGLIACVHFRHFVLCYRNGLLQLSFAFATSYSPSLPRCQQLVAQLFPTGPNIPTATSP